MTRSPFLDLPGAVAADAPDAAVPGHYGDPLREQRALAEAVGLVDRGNRDVLRVTGADRLSWLHSLTSQHLDGLPPWQPREGLVLSPHGHVEQHFVIVDDGAASFLDVEPGTASELMAFLDSMRFLLRVDVADVTAEWAVLTVAGPDTGSVLRRFGGPDELPTGAAPLPGGGFLRRREWPGTAVDLVVPRASLPALAAELVAPVSGFAAFEALRVAERRPRLGFETDHRTIPHEVGWLETAVHLDKGCYRGQETVARVHNLGRPPRRLVFLHLDGSVVSLPAHGEPVELDGARVGFVTSAARHYELGPIALALVKRSTPEDAELLAGGIAAKVEPAGIVTAG
ncbi:MAG TPA: glycine cleavage T C-terminal barrel domain-containing protein [Mycobacteriales bacterium]|nr:glycine cleavage T C-terminal barrel domain-containing protein [Mycobacteriales bacterium]